MQLNTTGGGNTAVGLVALTNNTTGNANTATGAYALENNTTGSNNTAVGQEALENNIVGAFNTAIGFRALQDNTNSSNTAIGYLSLLNNTSGDANFAGGALALENNTTGRLNVSVGYASLQNNTTGSFNIAIGDDAGRFFSGSPSLNTITNNSIYIGSQTRALANNETNQIVIGHNAIGNGSNSVTLGNTSITKTILRGSVGINTTSPATTLHVIKDSFNPIRIERTGASAGFIDLSLFGAGGSNYFVISGDRVFSASINNLTTASAANVFIGTDSNGITSVLHRSTSSLKYKKEIRDYEKGLDFIQTLRPVYYKGKNDGNKQFAGLIAEEVHDSGLEEFVQYAQDGSPDSLAYTHITALLINGIKELNSKIENLKN
jgi:hypothetical protein